MAMSKTQQFLNDEIRDLHESASNAQTYATAMAMLASLVKPDSEDDNADVLHNVMIMLENAQDYINYTRSTVANIRALQKRIKEEEEEEEREHKTNPFTKSFIEMTNAVMRAVDSMTEHD